MSYGWRSWKRRKIWLQRASLSRMKEHMLGISAAGVTGRNALTCPRQGLLRAAPVPFKHSPFAGVGLYVDSIIVARIDE